MSKQSKSAEKSKPKAKPSRPVLAREDALDILTSAIGYCREAGLIVTCENSAPGLIGQVVVTIEDAQVSDIGVQALFTVRQAEPPAAEVTA